jgi:hypothetical protein
VTKDCECDIEGRTVEVMPLVYCKKCKKRIRLEEENDIEP